MYPKHSSTYFAARIAKDEKLDVVMRRIVDDYTFLRRAQFKDCYLEVNNIGSGGLFDGFCDLKDTADVSIVAVSRSFKNPTSGPSVVVALGSIMEERIWCYINSRMSRHVYSRSLFHKV